MTAKAMLRPGTIAKFSFAGETFQACIQSEPAQFVTYIADGEVRHEWVPCKWLTALPPGQEQTALRVYHDKGA